MPPSRREFLQSAAVAGSVAALNSSRVIHAATDASTPGHLDDELPIHRPERPVGALLTNPHDTFAVDDAALIDHALPAEWRARLLYRLPPPR